MARDNAIRPSARDTYEWYLSNMRWLKLHLPPGRAEDLERHCRALEAILAEVPVATDNNTAKEAV